jgi:hypothetical protein
VQPVGELDQVLAHDLGITASPRSGDWTYSERPTIADLLWLLGMWTIPIATDSFAPSLLTPAARRQKLMFTERTYVRNTNI